MLMVNRTRMGLQSTYEFLKAIMWPLASQLSPGRLCTNGISLDLSKSVPVGGWGLFMAWDKYAAGNAEFL
jgi:hypothetical protein